MERSLAFAGGPRGRVHRAPSSRRFSPGIIVQLVRLVVSVSCLLPVLRVLPHRGLVLLRLYGSCRGEGSRVRIVPSAEAVGRVRVSRARRHLWAAPWLPPRREEGRVRIVPSAEAVGRVRVLGRVGTGGRSLRGEGCVEVWAGLGVERGGPCEVRGAAPVWSPRQGRQVRVVGRGGGRRAARGRAPRRAGGRARGSRARRPGAESGCPGRGGVFTERKAASGRGERRWPVGHAARVAGACRHVGRAGCVAGCEEEVAEADRGHGCRAAVGVDRAGRGVRLRRAALHRRDRRPSFGTGAVGAAAVQLPCGRRAGEGAGRGGRLGAAEVGAGLRAARRACARSSYRRVDRAGRGARPRVRRAGCGAGHGERLGAEEVGAGLRAAPRVCAAGVPLCGSRRPWGPAARSGIGPRGSAAVLRDGRCGRSCGAAAGCASRRLGSRRRRTALGRGGRRRLASRAPRVGGSVPLCGSRRLWGRRRRAASGRRDRRVRPSGRAPRVQLPGGFRVRRLWGRL